MKIYTRTGDRGTTALADGSRRPKSDPRLDAYGTVDELNSHLGLLQACAAEEPGATLISPGEWTDMQSRLFDIGAALATPGSPLSKTGRPTADDVTALEHLIDRLEQPLEPLRSFVLPAGTKAACQAHVARTVCRRAERLATALDLAAPGRGEQPVHPALLAWLNRLSDMLFTLARALNAAAHVAETPWLP